MEQVRCPLSPLTCCSKEQQQTARVGPSLHLAPSSKTKNPQSSLGFVAILSCPSSEGRGRRSKALMATLGARVSYSAHEDDGVEGSFPDEEQEGPVGVKDYSVHGEGTAGDGDGCSS